MGTGKTVVTLLAIVELALKRRVISKTLVVAPRRVAELVWHAEAKKWEQTKDLRVQRVLGDVKDREQALLKEADIYVINRENFAWLVSGLKSWPFDCVVIDENRGFKNRESRSWQALRHVRRQIKRLYFLTGTPAPNSLLELWPQISVMDGGQRLGKNITTYREQYFVPDKRGREVIYTWKLKPGAEQQIHDAVADVMFSVDGDSTLLERVDNVIWVSFDRSRYDEMAESMISGELVASSAGTLAIKLSQMANGACYDTEGSVHQIHNAKLEALEEILDQGEPVLCFTAYQHDQQRIFRHFSNKRVEVFEGEQSLRRWQCGEIDLLLMHPASGGHGVDGLQLGGCVAVWFGLPFSLDLYEQANARLHRSGQKKSVVIHHLASINTIDEKILHVLQTKGDMQQALLDAVKEFQAERISV
jgi:SNF2 family DNA or RNA helicase